MALWQLYAMRDALRGDSVIDLVFVISRKAACYDVKRHLLQILH